MDLIPQLIRQFSGVLYIGCAIACFIFIFVGFGALGDYRRATFKLERSSVGSKVAGAWLRALFCVFLGAGVFLISQMPSRIEANTPSIVFGGTASPVAGIILPTSVATAVIAPKTLTDSPQAAPTFVIQADQGGGGVALEATAVPTAALEIVPTATLPVPAPATPTLAAAALAPTSAVSPASSVSNIASIAASPTPASAVAAAPTVQSTAAAAPAVVPLDTPIPSPAATVAQVAQDPLPPKNCIDPYSIGIFSPSYGETISGQYSIAGNAGIPDGGYAKIEIMRPTGGGWAFLSRRDPPGVKEGVIASINASQFPGGIYRLRLVIVNSMQQETGVCEIAIRIAN